MHYTHYTHHFLRVILDDTDLSIGYNVIKEVQFWVVVNLFVADWLEEEVGGASVVDVTLQTPRLGDLKQGTFLRGWLFVPWRIRGILIPLYYTREQTISVFRISVSCRANVPLNLALVEISFNLHEHKYHREETSIHKMLIKSN